MEHPVPSSHGSDERPDEHDELPTGHGRSARSRQSVGPAYHEAHETYEEDEFDSEEF